MAIRVMVVDDALFMRNILKDIFVRHGYEVVAEAENGETALQLYQESKPDLVTMAKSLAGGLPAPKTFPVEHLREACDKVLTEQGTVAMQYGSTEGDLGLREELVKLMAEDGCEGLTPDSILVTSASQQALDLFADPGGGSHGNGALRDHDRPV